MKNVMKMLGIISLALVIVFSITTCGENDEPTTSPDAATLRYETVPYIIDSPSSTGGYNNLVYDAHDNTNNYYLFLLGHVNYVPLAYRDAAIYNGQTPVTIAYSHSDVSETSISRSVETAYANSVSKSSVSEWSISPEVGIKYGWFSAKVSGSYGKTNGWDETNTRSVANTFVTASSKARGDDDTIQVTIGNENESPGKYRFSFFTTTDVYFVLVTNRTRTQVTEAYTAVCARPLSFAWGIDYEPDVGGSFAKTAGGDLLTIPAIALSQLPDPTEMYDGSPLLSNGQEQEFDERGKTSFTIGISSGITRAIIIGDENRIYNNSEIIVAQRDSPLTIELNNVSAVGKNGSNGGTGQNGGTGRPVISMGSNMARVPDLTIISETGSNELRGGTGGNGGQGDHRSTGKNGGNGGAAILADKITIAGDVNIVLIGGNGGNGGRGGNLGSNILTPATATNGGNGGNGGASVNANNITVNIFGIVNALKSAGGNGGSLWRGSTGLASGGSNGVKGAQGVQFTSTPVIQNGVILDRR